jgi:hypothetical protein
MTEDQETQIQETEMQEHTSYPGKTPTELEEITNRLAAALTEPEQPAAQEPAAMERGQ